MFSRKPLLRNSTAEMLTATGIGGRAGVLPGLRLPAGFVDDPAADRPDQAAVFGNRHELRRAHQSSIGMPPADERLGAGDDAGPQVHLGLVEQLEFPLVERACAGPLRSSCRSTARAFRRGLKNW